MVPKVNFEQFLVQNQLIKEDVLKAAMAEALAKRITVYQYLLEKAVFTGDQLAQALAKFHQLEFRPMPLKIDAALAAKFPAFSLRRYKMVPLERNEKEITVAMVDPSNFLATDEVKKLTKLNVKIVLTTEPAIAEALTRVGGPATAAAAPGTPTAAPAQTAAPAAASQAAGASAPAATSDTASSVDQIMEHAIQRGASDLHFEPGPGGNGIIRERVDGIMHDARKMPLDQLIPIISRIKLLSGMDVVEKRLSQDGRFKHRHTKGLCEIRASILPIIFGEKLVLRILRNDKVDLSLDMLDLGKERTDILKAICDLPDGLVIVAGPTGSGKSTSLYAMLRALDRKSMNVITVEDPVEFELEHANQVQVNNKIGMTFASTLPTILRQDPDVILIGEVRDEETAKMVMRAAISGHLVFSTIHAPNCLETVIRLTDMGVEPHMVVAALKAAISQRLLRKLCAKCKKPHDASPAEKKTLGVPNDQPLTLYEPVGCGACHNLGYGGRFLVAEVLTLNEQIYEAILNKDRANLPGIAKASGFKSMMDHAKERVIEGFTTIGEMYANVPR